MTTELRDSIAGLLIKARNGDRAALDRLFAACRNYALIVAQAQTESWLQAKLDPSDLVQQSMLEAYRAFPSFQGETSAEWLAWLRRIVQHNALDLARHFGVAEKRQVGREVPLERLTAHPDGVHDPAASDMTPSELLISQEREVLVADALARLPAEHRQVIVLRNLQGLPFDEVARLMGRSRPAAQMLWTRALRKMQELLDQGSEVQGSGDRGNG
jgi:RNA polymerase sigma-70 factor (ECF subfamily)